MGYKEDWRRPSEVPEEVFVGNWERTFGAVGPKKKRRNAGTCIDCGGEMIERHGGRYSDCESCGAEVEMG